MPLYRPAILAIRRLMGIGLHLFLDGVMAVSTQAPQVRLSQGQVGVGGSRLDVVNMDSPAGVPVEWVPA